MTHPAFYRTHPFGGLHVMEVDPGTKIKDERTGVEHTVDDDTFVMKGNVCFCTKKTFEALKARCTPSPVNPIGD